MLIRIRTLVLFTCFITSICGAASPAALFRDGAVLQHGKPVPVWGTAEPGQVVSVTFAGRTDTVTTDRHGHWAVTFSPFAPSSEPAEMIVSGSETVRLNNIVVGEVWLASGQSNMEWRIRNSYDADLEAATANWPLIREFKVPRATADQPQTETTGEWVSAGRDTIADLSAVAYFFARDLHHALEMPIGIINSSWGGTSAEVWTDPTTLGEPRFAGILANRQQAVDNYTIALAQHEEAMKRWTQEKDEATASGISFTRNQPQAPGGPRAHDAPSTLYNGMIHPLLPYALRGAIWYQGESNARRHSEYHELFSAMITGWRDAFQQGDFPFYWVQLAEFRASGPQDTEWAFLREAQTQTLSLPATGQAVILDVSDFNDIHPRNKHTVGRRLARLALNRTYEKDVVDSGPTFAGAEFDQGKVRIQFSGTSGGIRTTAVTLRGFELAGEDQLFHPATAVIDGETVMLVSDQVPTPVAVRYAWRNAPEASLSNGAGLPATPFRTDAWEN